jgi:hypothetical protein
MNKYNSLLTIFARTVFQLYQKDIEQAKLFHLKSCPHAGCFGILHQSKYHRKPRGIPDFIFQHLKINKDSITLQFSFCCSVCRKRLTPPSHRFFSQSPYWSCVVLWIAAWVEGKDDIKQKHIYRFHQAFDISFRTIARWKSAVQRMSQRTKKFCLERSFPHTSLLIISRTLRVNQPSHGLKDAFIFCQKILSFIGHDFYFNSS